MTGIFYDTWDQVPKDSKGNPTAAVVNAIYLPTVSVENSGTIINLNLNFRKGTGWFFGPTGGISSHDMTGWCYSIPIQLDFAGIAREDLQSSKAVPPIVLQRLTQFSSDGFAISQLFIDFDSVDLMQFDPTHTTAGNSQPGSATHEAFVYVMVAFLGFLQKNPAANPYILGYTVAHTATTVDPDKDVPQSLKPIGQTFTLYKDPVSSNLSNINFVLNTADGQGPHGPGSHQTPGALICMIDFIV